MKPLIRLLGAIAVSCIALAVSAVHAATPLQQTDIAAVFKQENLEGTFVLLNAQNGEIVRHNPERSRQRFLPASTFKIPNTLIALESGVAIGPDFALTWNAQADPRQSWWPAVWAQDHTLRTALPNSVVWFYKEIARRVGPERMQSYLNRMGYGNGDISGGIDQFWLSGGLGISAEEQVHFLHRFYFGKLGVSERTTRVVKDLLVLENTPQYRLSGKTGWAALEDKSKPQTGWLVGYLEREGQVYFYATNIEIRKDEDAAARHRITKTILRNLGLLQ
ncbi:class D beta-lactamase [Noviherbaspirillum saxi]|uniref:Beta-lactamase n=1 Tax=Noviherbaspirillum saxi TaxID=2320863 RepID=A0A3A3FF22_9BURK|nr:class D beta-lactamase [Noviherbaspirillum saxi]RJF91637.1 class D beta-lactamase [Noviherbaspirillum saxi]